MTDAEAELRQIAAERDEINYKYQLAQARVLAAHADQWLPEQFVSLDLEVDEDYDDRGAYREFSITAVTTRDGQVLTQRELLDADEDVWGWGSELNAVGGYDLAREFEIEQRMMLRVRGDKAGDLAPIT